ncbi:DUF86 domain-containing protein [Massilia sp. R2A-15]|uniref:HepT-like ribonuclease domain-containing protein n=1 Tax=Massilia sp. R2A-15 TaxID=3064278 RepID=UPI002733866A|nr:DUF86 domain-containing protein [Massilia sp. R2A-15]WLI91284.1 DUF86 domain-containing protein [Massilia sp. R2A-15]
MSKHRLSDYLTHLHQAASDASGFVTGMKLDEFLADKRTQQAVIMNLIIIGEAATRVMEGYGHFAAKHPEIAWSSMRGMRNRIAHGYFDISVEVVWQTIQTAVPELLEQLAALHPDADTEERKSVT